MKRRHPHTVSIPKYFYPFFFIIIITGIAAFQTSGTHHQKNIIQSKSIEKYFLDGLKDLQQQLNVLRTLCSDKISQEDLKTQWLKSILQYKRIAVLTEYFNPYEVKLLNAPAINRVEPDNPKVILEPHGFQLIEELLDQPFNDSTYLLLDRELVFAMNVIHKMRTDPDLIYKFKDESIFEALRFAVIRLIALDISGFDSPMLAFALQKAHASFSGIRNILQLYQPALAAKDGAMNQRLEILLDKINVDLSANVSFDSFDRIHFIKNLANPLYLQLNRIRHILAINFISGRVPLNPDASSVFGTDFFNISFFSPDERYSIKPDRVELGRLLFYDPLLSSSKKRSCASCHKPELAFTDGVKVPVAVDEKSPLKRNTPTLWNTVFQTRQFFDSRTDFLENQLDEVIHNAGEMGGSLKQSVEDISKSDVYSRLFRNAYEDQQQPITPFTIANAISSYVRSLVALNSRFDQFMNGDESKLSEKEKKGFNLFMGKARCATCHFIPLFNGLLPPQFEDSESEVIGVPASKQNKKLDTDMGKSAFTEAETDHHSFKTPTVRNIDLTGPYMHNGVFRTLRQVVDFYNKGGGIGSFGAPANQTLLPDPLELSKKECKELISFMRALTDTTYRPLY